MWGPHVEPVPILIDLLHIVKSESLTVQLRWSPMDPVPPRSRDRAPTIRDVARHANVGVGTVSRVLNDSPLVSEDARQRVYRTIDELGYRRSSTARNLSLGRTQMIGVVAPFFTTSSVLERLRGVVDKLRDHGDYDLVLFDVETLTQRVDAFRDFARTDRVDGLLVMSLRPTDDEVERLRRERLPVVLVDVVHPALPRVVIDDVLGGTLATEHLLARGHTKIGFVGDEPSPFGFTSSERPPPRHGQRAAPAPGSRGTARSSARPARPRAGARVGGAAAALAGPADRDLRRLGRAGDGRARSRPGDRACACPRTSR